MHDHHENEASVALRASKLPSSFACPDAEVYGERVVRPAQSLERGGHHVEHWNDGPLEQRNQKPRSHEGNKEQIQSTEYSRKTIAFRNDSYVGKVSQNMTKARRQEPPIFLIVILHEYSGGTEKTNPAAAKNAPNFRSRTLRIGKIFENLGADHEVELFIRERQSFSECGDIHEGRDLGIYSDISCNTIAKQFPIRLKPPADVEHRKLSVLQMAQPLSEDFPPAAQDQPVRVRD